MAACGGIEQGMKIEYARTAGEREDRALWHPGQLARAGGALVFRRACRQDEYHPRTREKLVEVNWLDVHAVKHVRMDPRVVDEDVARERAQQWEQGAPEIAAPQQAEGLAAQE